MSINKKRFRVGTTICEEQYRKFKHICEDENRTVAGRIRYMIRRCVDDYESSLGAISFDK